MIHPSQNPGPVRSELAERFSAAIHALRKSGVRLALPASLDAGQTAWPENCPLSQSELRAKARSLVDEARALEAEVESLSQRAQEIYDSLPEPPAAECEAELPQSVYYALYDCLSVLSGEEWFYFQLSYVDELLYATVSSPKPGI